MNNTQKLAVTTLAVIGAIRTAKVVDHKLAGNKFYRRLKNV